MHKPIIFFLIVVVSFLLSMVRISAMLRSKSGEPGRQIVSTCEQWSLVNYFRLAPNQENPNRDSCGNRFVWYFMNTVTSIRDPKTYALLPNFNPITAGYAGFQTWQGLHPIGDNNSFPFIGINSSNVIIAHPWSMQESAVIGWRSPVSGNVRMFGSIIDGDNGGGDGVLWFVDRGSTNLASGAIDNGGRQNLQDGQGGSSLAAISVDCREFIYLVINMKGDNLFDSTVVDMSISPNGDVSSCSDSQSMMLPLILH